MVGRLGSPFSKVGSTYGKLDCEARGRILAKIVCCQHVDYVRSDRGVCQVEGKVFHGSVEGSVCWDGTCPGSLVNGVFHGCDSSDCYGSASPPTCDRMEFVIRMFVKLVSSAVKRVVRSVPFPWVGVVPPTITPSTPGDCGKMKSMVVCR